MSILDQVIPFKQVRPGDTLEPVQEWSKQFEGAVNLESEVLDFFVDNADVAVVPHGLQRDIVGAIVIGVKGDFITAGKAFAYAVKIDLLTEETFEVEFTKIITGTLRFWVF